MIKHTRKITIPVNDPNKKNCPSCNKIKPLSEFYKRKERGKGVRCYCKICQSMRKKLNWPKERKYKYKSNFNITIEQYDEMFKTQNGVCAICGEKIKIRLCIDHCHKTLKVRGLLCSHCNLGLGYFKDNLDILASATSYLINSV